MAFDYFVSDEQGASTPSPVQVRTTATTNSSGVFTVDISGAGFTHVSNAYATIIAAGAAVNQAHVISLTTMSTSTLTGTAFVFTTTLGVLNLTAAGSGISVKTIVEGDQA
jgi:hypothetical protein